MITEAHICAQIADWLYVHREHCWWFRPHGHGMQRAGVPDFVGIFKGWGFGIEVKGPKGKLSLRQRAELLAIAEAGGIAIVAKDVDHVRRCFAERGLA